MPKNVKSVFPLSCSYSKFLRQTAVPPGPQKVCLSPPLVKTQLEIEDMIGEKIMQGIQNSSKLLQTKAWLSCSVIGRPNVLHDALYHNA